MPQKSIEMTTPKGVAVYPRLKTPDTKFAEMGMYKSDLRIATDVAQPLIDKLTKIYRDHTGKAHSKHPERSNKDAFYYIETDENGDETGNVVFKLRVKNRVTKKGDFWDRQPAQFDAMGRAIADPKNIGGGSVLRVSFEIYCWETPVGGKGMSLQPMAVQILELQEFTGGRSADSFGFDPDEDGYVSDDDTNDYGFDDESSSDGDDYVSASEDNEDY